MMNDIYMDINPDLIKSMFRDLGIDKNQKIKVTNLPEALQFLTSLGIPMKHAVTPESYCLQAFAGIKEAEEVIVTLEKILESIRNSDFQFLSEISNLKKFRNINSVPEYEKLDDELPF